MQKTTIGYNVASYLDIEVNKLATVYLKADKQHMGM